MDSRSGRMILAALSLACAAVPQAQQTPAPPSACAAASQTLFYSPHARSESLLPPGFSDSLWAQLDGPVRELGYCLKALPGGKAPADTAGAGDNLFLEAWARDEGGGTLSVSIAALRLRDLARGKLPEAEARPLVYLRFAPFEALGMYSVLAKKVAENLRSQYVAVLLIRSHPAGAVVHAASGLEGKTPVEWVVPLGDLPITVAMTGYLEAHRDLDLAIPGQHTYDLQLAKRRFYHSKFIYPTLAAGAVSAVAFVLENHYYGVYQSLGPADGRDRPEAFGQNFRAAKSYERIGYTSMALAWLGLTLCFTF
jgi:hypothetical protein